MTLQLFQLVEEQRAYFNTGETKKLEVRKELLNLLKRCGLENTEELCQAVYKDLRRLPEV
uniref:THOC2_N domain-containing protein n=1 Tax=Steinernema glaseri TaxID=37863 RepID=A0A1I8AEC6_9BILA